MGMLGSEFVQRYSRSSPGTWEQAALDEARLGSLTPWPLVPITLTDGNDTAVLGVQSDVLAIGSIADFVRIPLTPAYAQSILNLSGSLLPTPWLEYRIWQSAEAKLTPISMVPNQGASLEQYAKHSQLIDIALARQNIWPGTLVAGVKKGVVVANFYKPGKVLLFGWYRRFLTKDGALTDTLAPDVFDDGKPIGTENRQPIQPRSNVHAEGYVDYSHGIRLVAPTCQVNGETWETVKLYQHPTLSRLVNPLAANANAPSQAGALFMPRYPAPVPPAAPMRIASGGTLGPAAIDTVQRPAGRIPFTPDPTEIALDTLAAQRNRRS